MTGDGPCHPRPFRQLVRRFLSGAFWSVLSNAANRAVLLFAGILVARWCGKDSYGLFGIVQSTAGMFAVFATYGVSLTANKYVASLHLNDPARTGRIIGLSTLSAVGLGVLLGLPLALFASPLAASVLAAAELAVLLRIGAIFVGFGAINGAWNGVLNGLQAFRTISVVNLVSVMFSLPLMIVLTYFFGLPGAVWGLSLSVVVECLFKYIGLRQQLRTRGLMLSVAGSLGEWRILYRFSLPTLLANVLPIPVNWASYAWLINHTSYGQMGLYNAALQWRMAILYVPTTLAGLIISMLSSSRGDALENSRLFKLSLAINLTVSIVATLVVWPMSGPIMSLYGAGFEAGSRVLTIAAVTTAPVTVANLVAYALTSRGEVWRLLFVNILWAAGLFGVFFAIIDRGATGLATANLVAYTFQAVILFGAFRPRYQSESLPTAA